MCMDCEKGEAAYRTVDDRNRHVDAVRRASSKGRDAKLELYDRVDGHPPRRRSRLHVKKWGVPSSPTGTSTRSFRYVYTHQTPSGGGDSGPTPHHPMTQLHVCENGVAVRKWCGGMGVRHGLGSWIGALTGGRPSASDLPRKSSRVPILHSHRGMAAALLPSQDALHLTPSGKT